MHALFCLAKENKKISKKIPKKSPKKQKILLISSRRSDEKLLK